MCCRWKVMRWLFVVASLVAVPSVSYASEKAVLFASAYNDDVVYFATNDIGIPASGFAVPGAISAIRSEYATEKLWLSFPRYSKEPVLSPLWRLKNGILFELIEKSPSAGATPQFQGIVMDRFEMVKSRSAQVVNVDPTDPSLREVKLLPIESVTAKKWIQDRSNPQNSTKTFEVIPSRAWPRSINGFLLLREVRREYNFQPILADFFAESETEFVVAFVANGCLECWNVNWIIKNPLQTMKENWVRDSISHLGITEPFRLVRAKDPIVLVTHSGSLLSHLPGRDIMDGQTETINREVVAVIDRGDNTVVFASDNTYTIVPRVGPISWKWTSHQNVRKSGEDRSVEKTADYLRDLLHVVQMQ